MLAVPLLSNPPTYLRYCVLGQSHLNLNALNIGKVSINAPYAPDVAILDMGKTMTFPKPTPYMLIV